MKQVILSLTVILLSLRLMGQDLATASNPEEAKFAAFTWEQTEHNFGKIEKDVPVTTEFTFVNSGSVPMVITEAKGSCGCTVTDYTQSVIEPGRSGTVTAIYNAAKLGVFSKSVTVTANTQYGPEKLMISGEVLEKN